MAINTDLLVMAPVLQDYLVDKDSGLPMANGTITLYQDNSRTTLKNWYEQIGTAGNYSYVALPNPLTLSAIGTIQDNSGNDILPFYYPYDENSSSPVVQTYYIVVQNSNGEIQFTRENFPFTVNNTTPVNSTPSNQNLIVNNVFWRNVGSLNTGTDPLTNTTTINGITYYYETLAPSQHDGFTMADIQFFKNANDATDVISFNEFVPPSSATTFADQILENDVTPEFYMNINCTGTGTETAKYIQIPLSLHVRSLSGYTFGTLVLQAMAVPGSINKTLNYAIFQFLGTGNTSPATTPIAVPLNESWKKYIFSVPLPSAANLLPAGGGPGDDALYLQISFPTASIFNINIAKPSFYLTNNVPTDDFSTYDQVNAIISAPRTGDIRVSTNKFQPYGWVPMNDGTIGSPSSNASTRANNDTWQLFNLLWSLAKPYDTGSNLNPICQMYTSAGAATNYSSSAIGDFDLNHRLALTRAFGRVLLGSAPISTLLTPQSTTYTASNVTGNLTITTANTVNFFNGMPIIFTNTGGTLPGGLVTNAVYYVSAFTGTNSFFVATSFNNTLTQTVLPYVSAGTGTNTVTAGIVGTSEGEYGHLISLNEMKDHHHNNPSAGAFVINTPAGLFSGGGLGDAATETGGITGYGSAQLRTNITQPGTFYNLFIKL